MNRTLSRHAPAWIIAMCSLVVGVGSAAANASLGAVSASVELREASFDITVDVMGTVAVIETRQVITNPSQHPVQAVYTFDVPLNAAVVDAKVRLPDGRMSTTVMTTAKAALTAVSNPEDLDAAPDLVLVRLVERDLRDDDAPGAGLATYELRAYPLAPQTTTAVTTRWIAPLRYQDGRLILRIPRRGNEGNLVRERIVLSARPPAGIARFAAIHGGGKLLGRSASRTRFRAEPDRDITVELVPDFGARSAPVVSFAAVPLNKDTGALGVSVLAPRPRGKATMGYERLLLIVDISRSMGATGMAAATTLLESLVSDLPPAADVEMIVYDREPRRVLGKFRPRQGPARSELRKALEPGALRNGSDLGAALQMARETMREPLAAAPKEGLERGVRAPTLVVIVSDGMTPLDLTDHTAISTLGDQVLTNSDVLAITLVPDGAPMPDVTTGPLAALAHETPGRSIAMRHAEAAERARHLAAELNRAAPVTEMSVQVGNGQVALALPGTLEAGQGALALGLYHGPRPGALTIAGSQRGKSIRLVARPDATLGRAVLPLALAVATPADMAPQGEGDPASLDSAAQEVAERGLIAGMRQASVVSEHTSLVAVDGRDRFAQDRLALLKKWGPTVFTHVPAPPEREPDHAYRLFQQRDEDSPDSGEDARPTGELDRDIIERLLAVHVMPRARACYEAELRRDVQLHGSMTVVLELARGEVQYAAVDRSTMSNASLDSCVRDAAYSIQVPAVAQGQTQEAIGLVRYPLSFRRLTKGGDVRPGTEQSPSAVDLGDGTGAPLDGLKHK